MQTVVAKDDENAQRHKTDFNKKHHLRAQEMTQQEIELAGQLD